MVKKQLNFGHNKIWQWKEMLDLWNSKSSQKGLKKVFALL